MIELKDVSFQYENSDKESVSHINISVDNRQEPLHQRRRWPLRRRLPAVHRYPRAGGNPAGWPPAHSQAGAADRKIDK